ncbi:MAG: DUF2889 domain-containing protein [Aquabacterium sp.]
MRSPGEDLHAGLDTGWILPEHDARTAVHTRSIVCRSFRRDDGGFDIDARFVDTRAFAYHSTWRGDCEAGAALHHMQIRVTIDRKRTILALHAAMPATPYDTCPSVQANFQRLVGLSLARGFRKAMRERIGGGEGCTHVLALMDAVSAAAVQTIVSTGHAAGQSDTTRRRGVYGLDELENTCWSYRSESPILLRMREMADAQAAAPTAPPPHPPGAPS